MNYIFVGGTYRGFKLFEHLISIGYKPSLTFILIEDEHEQLVYSPLIAALCEAHQIPFDAALIASGGFDDEEAFTSIQQMLLDGIDFDVAKSWKGRKKAG